MLWQAAKEAGHPSLRLIETLTRMCLSVAGRVSPLQRVLIQLLVSFSVFSPVAGLPAVRPVSSFADSPAVGLGIVFGIAVLMVDVLTVSLTCRTLFGRLTPGSITLRPSFLLRWLGVIRFVFTLVIASH